MLAGQIQGNTNQPINQQTNIRGIMISFGFPYFLQLIICLRNNFEIAKLLCLSYRNFAYIGRGNLHQGRRRVECKLKQLLCELSTVVG